MKKYIHYIEFVLIAAIIALMSISFKFFNNFDFNFPIPVEAILAVIIFFVLIFIYETQKQHLIEPTRDPITSFINLFMTILIVNIFFIVAIYQGSVLQF